MFDNYIAKIETDIRDNPRAFWRYVKSKKQSNTYPSTFHYGQVSSSNGDEICNMFGEYFRSNFLMNPSTNSSSHPHMGDETNDVIADIGFVEICEEEIFKLLKHLDLSKSAGPDSISPVFVRNCAKSLTIPLSILFKRSLSTGVVPIIWKSAYITPIHKKGSKTCVENYRPISKLCVFAKVLEKIVYRQTECLVDESKIENSYTEEMLHNMKEFCKALTPTILKPIVEAHKHKPKIEPEPTSEPKMPPTNEPKEPPTNEPKIPPTNEPKVPATSELNVPATSELNVPPTNKSKVPLTNEPKVPPTNEPKVPPKNELNVPPTNEPKVPPTSELNVPPTNESKVPPSNEPKVPTTNEPKVPVTNDTKEPPTNEPEVPSTNEPKVPAMNEPKVLPTNEPKVPPTSEPKVPPMSEPKVPPTSEPKVPATSSPDVIPTQPKSSTDVTPELSYFLCKKDKRHCYSGEKLESVVKLVVSICACSNKQISTDNPVECTIDNGLHGLSSTMTTAMDRLCETIGEIYDKFEEMGDLEEGIDDDNKLDKKVPVIVDLHRVNEELPNTEEHATVGMQPINIKTNFPPDSINIEKQVNVQLVEQKEKKKTNNQLERKTEENTIVNERTEAINNLSNSSRQGTPTNEEQNLINESIDNGNNMNPPNKAQNSKSYPGNENEVLNNPQNIPNLTLDKFRKKQQHLSNEHSGNEFKELKQHTSHSTVNRSNKNFDNNSVSSPKNRNILPNDAQNIPNGINGNTEDKSGNKNVNNTEISLQNGILGKGSNNSTQNNLNGENLTTGMGTNKTGSTTEGPVKRKKQPKNKTVNIDSRHADE
ncbi:hypothetical protein B5X24_HaOG214260 [Helicoverpa armigera]|nr:hypothetical protein B5X24_HaOG214260 [Helicoverpa armigera]